MVSKAALRPRRTRTVSKPESAAMRRSLVIFYISAVSVLWKPECNCSYKLLMVKQEWVCAFKNYFLKFLERKGKLEMGRRLLKLFGFAPG